VAVRYGLAVDLGTTTVAAAVGLPGGPETVLLGDRNATVPAVVHLAEDGRLLTGEAAARRAAAAPLRTLRHLRRRLGDPTPVLLAGRPFDVADLLAAQLRDVVALVTRTRDGPPGRIALTRPTSWGPTRLGLFEEVAHRAGITAPLLVAEPVAVAARYAETRGLPVGALVAVHRLGGGTVDAVVLRRGPRGMEQVGPGEGIERLGGVDLDDAVLRHVDFRTGGAVGALDTRDPAAAVALARLRDECTLAKETLSVDTVVDLPVYLPGAHVDLTLTRADLEGMLRAPVESSVEALPRALRAARVAPGDLTAVVLAGGSARIPLVARMVRETLAAEAGGGPTPRVDVVTEPAAALGAAGLAGVLPLPVPAHPAPERLPAAPGPPPADRQASGSPAPEPRGVERPAPVRRDPPPPARSPEDPATRPAAAEHEGDWPVRSSVGRGVAVAVAVLAVVAAIVVLVFVVLNRVRDTGQGPEPAAPTPTVAVPGGPR
jgi:molecular chaperone DnaK (HSP70)